MTRCGECRVFLFYILLLLDVCAIQKKLLVLRLCMDGFSPAVLRLTSACQLNYLLGSTLTDVLCLTLECRANTLQSIEKSFYLSRVDRELLQKPNYDLQVLPQLNLTV
jgi:predicted membrane metal-binding protein